MAVYVVRKRRCEGRGGRSGNTRGGPKEMGREERKGIVGKGGASPHVPPGEKQSDERS